MKPKVRFKGFEGEWEECILSQIADRYDGQRVPVRESDRKKGNIPYYGANGIQDYVDGYTHDGEFILIAEDGANDLNNYPVQYVNGKVWVNNHAHVVAAKKEEAVAPFLKYAISRSDIKSIVVGGTRVKLTAKAMMGLLLKKPHLIEQSKLSQYFQSLDSLIQSTTHKVVSLKQLKAASLISMFPQEGETKPKVRFKGFEGKWESCFVYDLLIERNEQYAKTKEYPLKAFVAYSGIVEKGERYDRSALVSDEENKLYKRTCYGDFIYSSNNLETGSIGLNTYGNASISPVYSIFYCSEKADPFFVGFRMTCRDFINDMVKWRQGVMYGQWRIHEKDFLSIPILTPTKEEQTLIGQYFQNLDAQIRLQEQRLEKLKQIKAACLEQMFV